jgi:hypothetical protein
MTWIVLAAGWLVVAVAMALLLGGAVRLADRRATEERLFTFLEADLRSGSSAPRPHGPRAPTAG